ncbi:S-adenosyl-L-methionine-dependent methyltransferase [Aspergillus steynii IBT 23096]|uniref:S-adenosyl-L-methionine-dependent methyltransferase n=1 Tax=Aspergillus steynii IBT 23096 TaxID=1392250 RepID=A0A2I2GS81_9EURO|nr:S-adenosyl-L-methionine-dependent methyltransferase [Aspergillus steynii IBT 23096]PLB55726.1 S-adenosyl-L-methionine-dependent methyltransferase [Aspergillus steynii IBT 23096]
MGSIHQNDESISLITQLSRRAPRLSNDQDRDAKRECLQLSKALTAQLEQPENVAIDLAGSPMIAVSARIAVDLNLFALILHHGPVTSARLAKLSGAEELLIVRILRPLSAEHFVEETAARTWQATRITQAMSTAEIAAGYRMISQLIVPAMQSAPSYFQTRGPSCPIDPTDGLVQHAFQTTQTTFDRIAASPSLLSDFALFMGNTMGARKYWVDWYPVQERILDGADTEKVLIVDVGGGKGHDLMAYQARFPNSGKLVLEDLKAVTDAVDGDGDLDPGIQRLEYDFFTRQPVCGARVYFYHHILHDWSDAYCLRILDRVAAAMTPGYSRLLIHEMLVLERGASRFQAQLDMTMMAFNGGMERTREQWRALLERAGLTVVGFWDPVDEGGDGIVEAMVS